MVGILDQDGGESDMAIVSERSSRSRPVTRSPANGFIKSPANGVVSDQVIMFFLVYNFSMLKVLLFVFAKHGEELHVSLMGVWNNHS